MGWDHGAYELETQSRMTPSQRSAAPALRPADDRERLMVETAYRRGFAQGFYLCLEAAIDGVAQSVLKQVYRRITVWRALQHGGRLVLPPVEMLEAARGESRDG